jgi:hypothetical protein
MSSGIEIRRRVERPLRSEEPPGCINDCFQSGGEAAGTYSYCYLGVASDQDTLERKHFLKIVQLL